MLKVMNETLMVDFYNRPNRTESGRLLVYELTGDACVLVRDKKVWIPFSKLTRGSRKQVFEYLDRMNGRARQAKSEWADPKIGVIVTLMVIWLYLKFMM